MAKRTGNHAAGDAQYNARRREYRAAQRYLKKAYESSGATASKNRALAKAHLENALATYDPSQKQRISAPIVNLAAEFGIDIQGARGEFITSTEAQRKKAVEKSKSSLHGTLTDADKRRELEAQALISNPSIGKRIMGGLVDVWKKAVSKDKSAAENRQAAQDAIFKYFGVDNWADVLDKIKQNAGVDVFATDMSELDAYDIVRIAIQKGVRGNTLIA